MQRFQRMSGRHPAVLVLLVSAGLSACSLVQPATTEVFVLTLLNEQPLPGILAETPVQGGHLFAIQLTRSTIRLQPSLGNSSGWFTVESEGWRVWDRIVTDTAYVDKISGRYQRIDSTLVVNYNNPYGFELKYVVRNDGRTLFSRQHVAPGVWTALEYLKQ
jgi:hypothetical protein